MSLPFNNRALFLSFSVIYAVCFYVSLSYFMPTGNTNDSLRCSCEHVLNDGSEEQLMEHEEVHIPIVEQDWEEVESKKYAVFTMITNDDFIPLTRFAEHLDIHCVKPEQKQIVWQWYYQE